MEMGPLGLAVVASALSGAFSALATIAALRVHIVYLREGLTRVEQIATRAHTRIDNLEYCAK